MSKTKTNKTVFQTCQKHLGTQLEQHGYKPHPAYQSGWEPSYQEYVGEWLREDLSSGIDEVSMSWQPEKRFLRISRRVIFRKLDGIASFQELPTDPSTFSDFWLNNPFVRFTLLPRPRRFWQIRKMDLRFLPKDIASPEVIRKVIDAYVFPYLPILLAAHEEQAHNRHIDTDHVDVSRTAQ